MKFGLKVLSPVSGLNLCLAPVSSSLVIVRAPGGFAANERASTPRAGCMGAIELSSSTASVDLSSRVYLIFGGGRSIFWLISARLFVASMYQPSAALDAEAENCLSDAAIPSVTREISLANGLPREIAEVKCHLNMVGVQVLITP